jgi:hypothetical protein
LAPSAFIARTGIASKKPKQQPMISNMNKSLNACVATLKVAAFATRKATKP